MNAVSQDEELTARELVAELERDAGNLVIVDVRAPGETARWRIEGPREVRRVERAYWDVLDAPEVLRAAISDDALAVVVCAYGNTSAIVAEQLRALRVDARSLQGGMVAWSRLHVARTIPGLPASWYLVQLDRPAKACLSYVVGIDGGPALVVDPDRFHGDYLEVVGERGSTVAGVVDTHLHADHISGGSSLAKRTGSPYFLADDDGTALDHLRPTDGHVLLAGKDVVARAVALHSPGHTPGSTGICIGDDFLLSGDTLFVRGVGRPDLGGRATEWATDLHRTLVERLAPLPDDAVVLPAHYQDSSERDLAGRYAARLGELRQRDEFSAGLERFLARVTAEAAQAPREYDRIRLVNLGAEPLGPDDLEIGKNQCASGAGRPSR